MGPQGAVVGASYEGDERRRRRRERET